MVSSSFLVRSVIIRGMFTHFRNVSANSTKLTPVKKYLLDIIVGIHESSSKKTGSSNIYVHDTLFFISRISYATIPAENWSST
jgi:hypothetical protein